MHQTQRIDICNLVATEAVNLDQARNRGLFLARRAGTALARHPGLAPSAAAGLFEQAFPDLRMCDFGTFGPQRRKVVAPGGRHRIRVLEVLFVQRFDRRRIGGEKRCRGVLFL